MRKLRSDVGRGIVVVDCGGLPGVVVDDGGLPADRDVHLRDLHAEHVLDGLPLQLHGGGDQTGLGGPGLVDKEDCSGDFKLLQPRRYKMRKRNIK